MLTESNSFSRTTILPVWIYEYHFLLSATKPRAKLNARISETKVSLTDWAFHNHLTDSDDEVATE